MKSKIAAAEWTTSKLVRIVLLVVLVAILVLAFPKQLGALDEKAGGIMDDIAVRFNLVDSEGGGKVSKYCRQGSVDEVAGVYGKMIVCPENCSFDISPNTLLGANKFFLTPTGFKIQKDEFNHLISADSLVIDVNSVERHREAYEELIKVFDDFYLQSSSEENISEFYSILDFDPTSYFTIIIDTGELDDLMLEETDHKYLKFYWDGERWERKYLSQSRYEENDNAVFEETYGYFNFGVDVYWKYNNDDTLMLPITNLDMNYQNIEFSDEQFSIWLSGKQAEVDNMDNVSKISIEIEQEFGRDKYFYKDAKWKKNGLIFNKNQDENFIFQEIIFANREGFKITWHYNKEKIDRIPVSGEIIVSRNIQAGDFERWMLEVKDNFTEDKESQEEFMEEFTNYFEDNLVEVSFEGDIYEVLMERVFREDESSIILIYFENDEDRFGIYYDNGEFVLIEGENNKDSYASDWVGLNSISWKEFLKINEIFDYIIEGCS